MTHAVGETVHVPASAQFGDYDYAVNQAQPSPWWAVRSNFRMAIHEKCPEDHKPVLQEYPLEMAMRSERRYYHEFAWAYELLQSDPVAPRLDFVEGVLSKHGIG